MKNCKSIWKAQTASRLEEVIEPPPIPPLTREKLTTSLEQKFS